MKLLLLRNRISICHANSLQIGVFFHILMEFNFNVCTRVFKEKLLLLLWMESTLLAFFGTACSLWTKTGGLKRKKLPQLPFTFLIDLLFTLSMRESPISAWEMSSPLELQIFIVQVGGGPVLAIVPAVVRVLTLKPNCRLFSPVW